MEKVGSFYNDAFSLHSYLINLILKKHRYHKSVSYEEYEIQCKLIYNTVTLLLDNRNYFMKDDECIMFYYNKFAFNFNKQIFYKPMIRQILISNFNVKNNIDTYVRSIITVLFCMLGNGDYFKPMLDYEENTEATHDMRKMNAVDKFKVRCLILDYIKSGLFSQYEIARILSVDRKTVRRIQRMLETNHFLTYEDLHDKKHGPAPNPYTKLNQEVCEALKRALNKIPSKFGLTYAGWGTKAIKEYLKKIHNIDVTENYLRYYLRKNNYTYKVGQRKNYKQSEEEVNDFLNGGYEKELMKAKQNNERVVFVDEMHVQQGYSNRSYAQRGKRAVTAYHQSAKHTKYSLITFMGLDGFISLHIVEGPMDSGWFIFFLKDLKKNNKGVKFLIFADNCGIYCKRVHFEL